MFTGIVDHCGVIQSIDWKTNSANLTISTQFSGLEMGESVAVDGVCLTVMSLQANAFAVEVSPETMRVTTLDNYKVGQKVNLERALRLQDRIGGHVMSGHVDQVAKVSRIIQYSDFTEMHVDGVSSEGKAYLANKGSITINGVSLTLNAVAESSFGFMLIPHTLERTNLADLTVGSMVNVEYDYLAKLVAAQLNNFLKSAATADKIHENAVKIQENETKIQ